MAMTESEGPYLMESAERYLKAGGMTDEQISLLRDKLTK